MTRTQRVALLPRCSATHRFRFRGRRRQCGNPCYNIDKIGVAIVLRQRCHLSGAKSDSSIQDHSAAPVAKAGVLVKTVAPSVRSLRAAPASSPNDLPREHGTAPAILDSLTAQIAVLDASGTIILANEAWKRLSHEHCCFCIADMKVGENYLNLCGRGGEAGAEVFHAIQDVLNGTRPAFCRNFACNSGRKQRWFLLSVTRLGGRKRGVVISRTEITAQKQAEAARAQLAAIVESSSSAITATTLDGIVMSWNRGAERLYGYRAREIVGRPIQLLLPPERFHELDRSLERLRRGEAVETFETMRRGKNGRLVPVELTISAIKDAKGTIIGASGIARDMTERRRLQSEVLHATEREQRRIAEDLHDGLAPQVAGIACLAKVLRDNLVQENSAQAALATKMANLLDEATAQTRSLARGLYPVPPEPTGLMSALQLLSERTTELHHVNCTYVCRRPILVEDGRVADHLYRIAQEAVINALRHAHPALIEVTLSGTRSRMTLGVRDDGTGIPVNHEAKGMGLRAMHYRANLISGSLVVQHAAGGGTHVRCTVNLSRYASHNEATS